MLLAELLQVPVRERRGCTIFILLGKKRIYFLSGLKPDFNLVPYGLRKKIISALLHLVTSRLLLPSLLFWAYFGKVLMSLRCEASSA